jgi:hypothetical protein
LLEAEPANPEAGLQSARILCAMGRFAEAIPLLERSLAGLGRRRPEAEALLELARERSDR